jgi:hypothetical protein
VFHKQAAEPYIVPFKYDHLRQIFKNVINGTLARTVRYSIATRLSSELLTCSLQPIKQCMKIYLYPVLLYFLLSPLDKHMYLFSGRTYLPVQSLSFLSLNDRVIHII